MASSADEERPLQDINAHFSEEARMDRMQLALLEVIDGSVARGRPRKYWENLKLKPQHLQMLLMKAAGHSGRKIAEVTGYTEARVSVIVNHPDAGWFLSHLISYQAERLMDIQARYQAHAGEALDHVLLAMRETQKPEVKAKIGFGILDRAGYGAVKKAEVTNKFEMPAAQADKLTATMREIAHLDNVEDADWESIEEAGSGPLEQAAALRQDAELSDGAAPSGGAGIVPPIAGPSAPKVDRDMLEADGSFTREKRRIA